MSEKPTLKQILPQLQSWCAVNNVSVQSVYDECHGMTLQDTVYYLFGVVKQASEEVVDYEGQFEELYYYVHDYFDNLDVQQEINNKLDEMASDGTLSTLMTNIWGNQVSLDFASSTSQMSDTSKNYVLTSNSHIYYYNGSVWVDSGIVYGATNTASMLNRGNVEANTSLADYKLPGYYIITSSVASTLTDTPITNRACIMLVMQVFGNTSLKVLYDINSVAYYIQYNNSTWQGRLSNNNSQYAMGDSFATTNKAGFYFFQYSQIENFNDKPANLTTGGVLLNVYDSILSRLFQIIISTDSTIYLSYAGSPWSEITKTFNGNFTSNKSIFSYNKSGYYAFTSNVITTVENKPDNLTVGGIMINYPVAPTNIFRFIISINYDIYVSYSDNAWVDLTGTGEKLTYYALGDSITVGMINNGSGSYNRANPTYPKIIGDKLGYNVTNKGVSSTGFLYGTQNAKAVVNANNFSDCDICTINYGTNDWRYSQTLGASSDDSSADTVCGALKYCIEKILNDNPKCSVYVITPLNRTDRGGAAETNYALSVKINGKTLQDFIDAITETCNVLGVPCISQTESYVINTINLTNLLSDGLHPNQNGYDIIGRFLASKINY